MKARILILAALFAFLLLWLGKQVTPSLSSGGDLPGRCRAAAKEAQEAVKTRQQHERNAASLQQCQALLWPADSSPSSVQTRLRALAQQAGCQLTLTANSEMKGGKEKAVDLLNCSARGEAQLEPLLRFIAIVEAQKPSISFSSCRLSPIPSKPGIWSFDAQIQVAREK